MTKTAARQAVRSYLREYSDSPVGVCPDPSDEVVQALRKSPHASFAVLMEFMGNKRPNSIDPRDIDIPMSQLLPHIASLVPELIIERLHKKKSMYRSMFIYSAAASEASLFVPELLDLLNDRSKFIKDCVLDVISQFPHLQVPEAIPIIEKLNKQRSFTSEFDRRELEKARTALGMNS